MNRRGFLAGVLAIPFAKPAIAGVLSALERVGAPAVAARGRAYFDMAEASACLKELYSFQLVQDLVYKDNVLLMMLNDPERYREYRKPTNVCRRSIERRRESPVESGYAAWRDRIGAAA